MSGKSAPTLDVSTIEIALAFKTSGLPLAKYNGFAEGYKLAKSIAAQEACDSFEQLPPSDVEVRP